MGKNNGNSWLRAVRKAFRSPSNEDEMRTSRTRKDSEQEREEEKKRGKRRWVFRKPFPLETTIQHNVEPKGSENMYLRTEQPKYVLENSASDQRRAIAVAMATTAAAEAVIVKAKAAIENIRLSSNHPPLLLIKQHSAAITIQSIFRGYLARKALLALKGIVKMQALIRGHNVRIRAKMTLQCMQSLVWVQAQVCDQRRMLSREGSKLSPTNTSSCMAVKDAANTTRNPPLALREIQALVQQARELSLKQRRTLAQMWAVDEDQFPDNSYKGTEEDLRRSARRDKNLCEQRDPINNVETDTRRHYYASSSSPCSHAPPNSYFIASPLHQTRLNFLMQSPKSPSSSKIKSITSRPRLLAEERNCEISETPTSLRSNYSRRTSTSENSCPFSQPNYMATTASTMARARSYSAPRQRPIMMSPNREQTRSAKKRLSFPGMNGYFSDDKGNKHSHRNSYYDSRFCVE